MSRLKATNIYTSKLSNAVIKYSHLLHLAMACRVI